MTTKEIPVGERYIIAQAAFEKKHADDPELVKEVKTLTDLLQMWHFHVMLAVWTELIKKSLKSAS